MPRDTRKQKESTEHASPSSSPPRPTHSSLRSRQKTDKRSAAAVAIAPSPVLSSKKEVQKSYSLRQRARNSVVSEKDENTVNTVKGNAQLF